MNEVLIGCMCVTGLVLSAFILQHEQSVCFPVYTPIIELEFWTDSITWAV